MEWRSSYVKPYGLVACEYDGPDIAFLHLVEPYQLPCDVAHLIDTVIELELVGLAAVLQPFVMIANPEDRWPFRRAVAAHALKDGTTIVQGMGEHMDLRIIPSYELSIHPDFLQCFHGDANLFMIFNT